MEALQKLDRTAIPINMSNTLVARPYNDDDDDDDDSLD